MSNETQVAPADISDAVAFLIARMEDHPEEFNPAEDSKFGWLAAAIIDHNGAAAAADLGPVRDVFTNKEWGALKAAFKNIRRRAMHKFVFELALATNNSVYQEKVVERKTHAGVGMKRTRTLPTEDPQLADAIKRWSGDQNVYTQSGTYGHHDDAVRYAMELAKNKIHDKTVLDAFLRSEMASKEYALRTGAVLGHTTVASGTTIGGVHTGGVLTGRAAAHEKNEK